MINCTLKKYVFANVFLELKKSLNLWLLNLTLEYIFSILWPFTRVIIPQIARIFLFPFSYFVVVCWEASVVWVDFYCVFLTIIFMVKQTNFIYWILKELDNISVNVDTLSYLNSSAVSFAGQHINEVNLVLAKSHLFDVSWWPEVACLVHHLRLMISEVPVWVHGICQINAVLFLMTDWLLFHVACKEN